VKKDSSAPSDVIAPAWIFDSLDGEATHLFRAVAPEAREPASAEGAAHVSRF